MKGQGKQKNPLKRAAYRAVFKRNDVSHAVELTYSDIDSVKYPRVPLTFNSGKNTLQGYLYPKDNARGIIVVISGMFSGADRHLSEITYFLDSGWAVFAFDGSGIGDSGGSETGGPPQTKRDLTAAVRALKDNRDTADLPLVLYGHSAGGYSALAVLKTIPDICAVVCMAGFNSPAETLKYHTKKRGGRLAFIEYPILRLRSTCLFGKDANVKVLDVLKSTDTPVMLIEGGKDEVVPRHIGLGRYLEQCENPNLHYMLIDEPYRNTHSSLWLSAEAARAAEAVNANEAAKENLTREDRIRINGVDTGFLDTVLTFFNNAVKKD